MDHDIHLIDCHRRRTRRLRSGVCFGQDRRANGPVTINLDLIGQMSCNPAIGGIAKGHLVREIDALGGVMGKIADKTGIQFRLLNRSRGPAVQSPRAQNDRALYRFEMRKFLENVPNLTLNKPKLSRFWSKTNSCGAWNLLTVEDLERKLWF